MCPREVCIEHGYSLYLCTRARLAEALSILRRIAYKGWDGILLIDPSDNCRPPRPGDTTVSLTWLKGVLGAAGLTDFGMEVKGLQENRGLVGSITCIRLTFSGTPPKVAGYNGLVLKMSTHGVQGRKRTIALSGEREARFYSSDFYRNLPHNFAPAVLYSYASSLFGESVLLMEDVTLREGARVLGVNMILGNQIWGVPQPTGEDPLQMLEAMFLRAAELHARFWHDNNLIDGNPWFKGALWYRNRGRLEWEAAIAFNHKAWQAAKELERGNPDIHFSEKLVRIIDASHASTTWEKLQEHLHDPSIPFTLCHGDFHGANMFFVKQIHNTTDPRSQADVLFFDWTEVGPWEPTSDLAQTIISDVKPELFKAHSKRLVRLYWNHLLKLGVAESSYPFETCWRGFCRGGVERWIWLFSVLASMPVPPQAIQYFHDQLLAFIEAHEERDCYHLKEVVYVV